MSLILSGPSLHPPGARTLLIMLHGYGASGDDLFTLVRNWASDDVAVWAPNAPIPVGFGSCWFPLEEDIDEKDIARSLGLHQTSDDTHTAMMQYISQHQVESVIIGGFSQGAMLALHIMAKYQPLWPVLGYGGGFFTLDPPRLDASHVCLIHGAEDDVVVPHYLTRSMMTLAKLGASVEGHLRPGVGHNIDLTGAKIGHAFVQRHTARRTSP